MLRLVLDTNAVLDLLVFRDRSTTALARALEAGDAVCISDEACRAELVRVLAYPQFAATPEAIRETLARYDSLARAAGEHRSVATLCVPRCRDPDDQKFLDLAYRASADMLITKDRALLQLARKTRGRLAILTPADASAAFCVAAKRFAQS